MNFSITDNQKEICSTILKMSESQLNKNIFKHDEESYFPREKWDLCCRSDILALPISEKDGGLGQDMLTTALAIKSLAYSCKDEGLIFALCAHLCTCLIPIYFFGTEEHKAKYLPKLISGEQIGGNGITETESGSDITGLRTHVKKNENNYTLNGSKIFVTNGPVADVLIIYARHSNGIPMADTSAFIIEAQNRGLKIGQTYKKMGLRTSTISEILLEDCGIPLENLLGRERLGLLVFNKSMLWERIIMAAYHIGSMEQQFNTVFEYANIRKQFGKEIIRFQNISDKIIEMRMRIETSRLLLYQCCWKYDCDEIKLSDASMLKLYVAEAKVQNSLDAVQIFGAYGYMKESIVEKQLRDSIAAKIYSGTSEIQKLIILENLGKIDGMLKREGTQS
ncbi:MAG: acyl-CoA dehydrogenase family protein [bacterium]